MDNKEIYRKTIGFSVRRILWDLLAILVVAVLGGGGYLLAEKLSDKGLIGLAIGLILGIIALVIFLRYISYTYKAGQIAMITRGVSTGNLPEDVIGEGKKVVKERFATVAIFYAATGIIKGIFNQLGRVIVNVGEKIGGDNGNAVGSAISAIIQVVVAYLCDCCLGWVFYREGVKPARATCEGAVLFFKHGKTLAKNMGRVFGMGLISLLLIGGIFSGIFYAIAVQYPVAFTQLSQEIAEAALRAETTIPDVLTNPETLTLICAALGGVILWSFLHSAFVRPFVLVGVLRNYIASGVNDIPSEASFAALDSKSDKFKKLHAELA